MTVIFRPCRDKSHWSVAASGAGLWRQLFWICRKKEKVREAQLKAYYNQQREIKHQEEVITKLKSFNREKSIKRAESREKLLDKIDRLEKPVEEHTDIKITLEPNILSGNDVLSVEV